MIEKNNNLFVDAMAEDEAWDGILETEKKPGKLS